MSTINRNKNKTNKQEVFVYKDEVNDIGYDTDEIESSSSSSSCIDALMINTFFDPDEYWQSLEVAHKIVFGYGYLTWEWKEMIRSFLHPFIFVLGFKFLHLFNLDTTYLIIVLPKLTQGIIAAIGDYYLYKLAYSIFGKECARWTLICQLISWYTFVCIVRTYSNSIECVMFIVSLYYWPLTSMTPQKQHNPKISIALTTIAFLIRPTTAIMWLFLVPLYIYSNRSNPSKILKLIIFDIIPVGLLFLTLTVLLDYYFYEKLTFVPYNFLYFNVIKGVSNFYGTHPFHWYFTQGFPTIAFTNLPLFLFGVWKLYKSQQQQKQKQPSTENKLHLAYLVFWTIFCYSLLAHKEFRFILPILPLVMIYSGYFIVSTIRDQDEKSVHHKKGKKQKQHQYQEEEEDTTTIFSSISPQYLIRLPSNWIVFLLVLNLPMIVFFSNFHQRSPIDMMYYINSNINTSHNTNNSNQTSIHFLMSCHSTPFQSYIHNPNIELKLLECPPPLTEEDLKKDEVAQFYENPLQFLNDKYKSSSSISTSTTTKNEKISLPNYFIVRSDLIPKNGVTKNNQNNDFNHDIFENKTVLPPPPPPAPIPFHKHSTLTWYKDRAVKSENSINRQLQSKQSEIFEGVRVYFDGYTEHVSTVHLKKLVILNGGSHSHFFSATHVTHIRMDEYSLAMMKNVYEDEEDFEKSLFNPNESLLDYIDKKHLYNRYHQNYSPSIMTLATTSKTLISTKPNFKNNNNNPSVTDNNSIFRYLVPTPEPKKELDKTVVKEFPRAQSKNL
eukprot:gene5548-6909_t